MDEDTVAIGIIGRLTAIKNHKLFMNALSEVAEQSSKKIKAFVIGDGELMEQLKVLSASIEEKIKKDLFVFTSWIKEIDLVLPGMDIVCLSSFNEGTPVSLIEAQAAGIPVITTNVGGVMNVVEHEKTGLIINSFEVRDYAKGLLSLVDSEEKRQKMSQNGWIHVKDKFHYLRLCKDMEKLYKELLKKKGKL